MKTAIKVSTILSLMMSFVFLVSAKAQTGSDHASSRPLQINIKTSAVCGMCKQTIEGALYKVKGVKAALLNDDTKVVEVVYNPKFTNPDAIRLVISKAGYDADDVAADPAGFEKLNSCCKKAKN